MEKYDFSGWATKNNLKCSDGRIIKKDAFKDCNGVTVPLVWNHDHNAMDNVIGHALLENRNDGVWAYCSFNETDNGSLAKELVRHGDIKSLSIYANKLKQNGPEVIHGMIREVSLVLAGANPGAVIYEVNFEHSDSEEFDAVICSDQDIELYHEDTVKVGVPEVENNSNKNEEKNEEKNEKIEESTSENTDAIEHANSEDKTVSDVFATFTEKEKSVLYYLISELVGDSEAEHADVDENNIDEVLEHATDSEETIRDVFNAMSEEKQTVAFYLISEAMKINNSINNSKGGNSNMKHNAFENKEEKENVLSHSDMEAIFSDAESCGSLKKAVLSHGIENLEVLFPDYQSVSREPVIVNNDTTWVGAVMNGVHKVPFSRIKSTYADITEDDARALGYIKGEYKKEETIALLKRTTDPTTIYKKQAIERDDMVDIHDFDVVMWIKAEMRQKLNEELARAILISDGRSAASKDKIKEDKIRPIWKDDDVYTIKHLISIPSTATEAQKVDAVIEGIVRSRKKYKGSGNPVMFTTEDFVIEGLLLKDSIGHKLYNNVSDLANACRVSAIYTVPAMENLFRTVDGDTHYLAAIVVNLKDYDYGADKGGAVTLFDDFDIDYNQMKYLIETRGSGALTKPYSAIAVEMTYSLAFTVESEDESEQLLGKYVSDLQSDVIFDGTYIEGTLKYVTGYTGYSGNPDLQKGNFLAIKVDATAGATVTVELLGGESGPITLDEDMNAVIRIANKSQKLKITCTSNGQTVSKVYGLRNLVYLNQ